MKLILRLVVVTCLIFSTGSLQAQCPGGYTQAQLNWDRLDYYHNNTSPYQSYVSNGMEQSQKFAIGPNIVTFNMSAPIAMGENTTHTHDVAGYTGEDAQFRPSSNNQTITMSFDTDVRNLSFTLYDVDYSQRINFSAINSSSVAQNINVVTYGSSILSISNNNNTNAYITSSSTSLGTSDVRGTATITVAGPVNSITLTVPTIGSNPDFWISDVNACVTGSFPNNYNQTGDNQPLQGPVVNQPDYFIITPDNNSAYLVDPATGEASFLFTDPENVYMNSFGYDPYNHILYYVSEHSSLTASNKKLKKYDFNTNTISDVISDISTFFNIPTFEAGLEGAGAAFYNGQLYIGVEGGRYNVSGTSNDRSREAIIYRIDFDGSLNPTNICQVFATPNYQDASNTALFDWADFVIKDGELCNFNSRTGTVNVVEHYNLMTGQSVVHNMYTNPAFVSQSGLGWDGTIYNFASRLIEVYNGDGTKGTGIDIIDEVTGDPFIGGAGDASENFRPQVDFGDAPSSYDPNAAGPASHVEIANLRLGANMDKEWITRGQAVLANSDNFEDGLAFVSTYNALSNEYLIQLSVFNNTGANATVCAWVDFDGDGQFEASEGITEIVGTSASLQNIWLYWSGISSPLSNGTYTYLRIRVTRQSDGMTVSHPTGYFPSGEVEDYRVPVNNYALSVQSLDFNASLTNAKTVRIDWSMADETDIAHYVIERSKNTSGSDWEMVNITAAKESAGQMKYEILDQHTLDGISYYRLKILGKNGDVKLSPIKKIDNKTVKFSITLAPNPAVTRSFVYIHSNSNEARQVNIELINSQGILIQNKDVLIKSGTNSIELEGVDKLSGGTYFVRVICGNEKHTQTLIIK